MNLYALTIIALLCLGGKNAVAQNAAPQAGGACTQVGTFAGNYNTSAPPDGNFLVCDGANWVAFMEFNADQNVAFPSGDVGIGTGSPAVPLDISGVMRAIDDAAGCTATERGAIRFNSADGVMELCDNSNWQDLASGSGVGSAAGADRQIQFNSGGMMSASSGLVFDSAGRLGIGTDSPVNTLHIVNGGITFGHPASNVNTISKPTTNIISVNTRLDASSFQFYHDTADRAGMFPTKSNVTNPEIYFMTNGAERLRIDNSGSVGIGTGSPAVPFDVAGIMRAVDDAAGCTATERGAIRFNSAGAALEVCDGGTWGGAGTVEAINDLTDAYTEYSTKGSIYLGDNAGVAASPGLNNVALGVGALGSLGTTCGGENECSQITAIGRSALAANTTGRMNTAVGFMAGTNTTTGSLNTFVGHSAGKNNTEGQNNAFFGGSAGSSNVNGGQNTALGIAALQFNSSGGLNTAVGYHALQNSTGSDNVAVGHEALVGAVGMSGVSNTAVGRLAMQNNAAGDSNVAMGNEALRGNTDGNRNIAIGEAAGDVITTGNENIIIGYDVDPTSATASNELNIGDTIYGDLSTGYVGIGTASPVYPLDVLKVQTDGTWMAGIRGSLKLEPAANQPTNVLTYGTMGAVEMTAASTNYSHYPISVAGFADNNGTGDFGFMGALHGSANNYTNVTFNSIYGLAAYGSSSDGTGDIVRGAHITGNVWGGTVTDVYGVHIGSRA